MRRQFIRLFRNVAVIVTAVLGGGVASAIQIPLILDDSNSSLQAVNPQSSFYKLDEPSSESGSGAGIFDFVFGTDSLGEFVELTWGTDPKPVLWGAGLKAGGSGSAAGGLYAMIWGASAFTNFNNSDAYNAIRFYQDGIVHKRNGQFLGISHVTLMGEPGQIPEPDVKVPDSGSAFVLLLLGLTGLFFFRSRYGVKAS